MFILQILCFNFIHIYKLMTISIQEINIFKINFNNHINKINYVLKKKNIYNILTNNRMLG